MEFNNTILTKEDLLLIDQENGSIKIEVIVLIKRVTNYFYINNFLGKNKFYT